MMGAKSWFWNRNEKREELEKKEVAKGNLPVAKKISYVSTKLAWFSKSIRNFAIKFFIDGVESEVGFYFTIPYLAHLSVTLQFDHDAFKKKWPKLNKEDLGREWGISITREYVAVYWNYISDNDHKSGFSWMGDWSDIIRGKNTVVEWRPCVKVLTTHRDITTSYRLSSYPKEVEIIRTPEMLRRMKSMHESKLGEEKPKVADTTEGPGIIRVPITIYERVGVWSYKRWWKIKHVRYEVASDVGIIVPGKGENSWDQDDEVCISRFDAERDSADFSCGGEKTPEAAADAYINSIKRKLSR